MDCVSINKLNNDFFKDFSINFKSGLFYNVVGNSQSGKTTLFNLILGSNNCDSITVFGSNNYDDYIKNIGFVNNDLIFFSDNVLDEIKFTINSNFVNKEIKELFKEFRVSFTKIDILSNSEKQKLLFLLCFINKPKIILIDDGFSLLNDDDRKLILDYLYNLDITIINFTKDISIKCDFIYVLDNFKIVASGNYDDIINDDQIFYNLGIKIPFMIDLSIKLKMYNMIDHIYYDVKDLVNDLCK